MTGAGETAASDFAHRSGRSMTDRASMARATHRERPSRRCTAARPICASPQSARYGRL